MVNTSIKFEDEIGNFKCQKIGCDKSFKTKLDLKRHLLAHLKIRTYDCEFCGKRFVSRHYLDDHYNIHTGERPYPCPHNHCRRRFRTAAKLESHIEKVHSPAQTSYIFPNLRDQGSVIHIHNGRITRIPLHPCVVSVNEKTPEISEMSIPGMDSNHQIAAASTILAPTTATETTTNTTTSPTAPSMFMFQDPNLPFPRPFFGGSVMSQYMINSNPLMAPHMGLGSYAASSFHGFDQKIPRDQQSLPEISRSNCTPQADAKIPEIRNMQ